MLMLMLNIFLWNYLIEPIEIPEHRSGMSLLLVIFFSDLFEKIKEYSISNKSIAVL